MVGYSPERVSTARPPTSVAEAMSHSDFYPGGAPVSVRETHTAWVFLTGDRAYKVKKPVRMEFLDFSTLERRRAVCLEEVRVNRELAASLHMRMRAIVARAQSYALVDDHAPDAVEYAIEMRRFDEERTMAALVGRGELTAGHVRDVATRLAAFHASARRCCPEDPVGDVRRTCEHNFRELFALADDATARRLLALERFAGAFLVTHRVQIAARAEAGFVRDGHGDLRADHVVFEGTLAVVDRLEFDPRLREVDVADDLAFLVMDLERLGASDATRDLVRCYRDAGGDTGSDALLSFYGAYRALVRVKVALLRAPQLEEPAAVAAARADADKLLNLAERFAWRARGPIAIAISGPPASGKSTLAAALARRAGWPVLSSDVLRKRSCGLPLSAVAAAADYTPAARADVYRELGQMVRAELADRHGAIVDATFGEPSLRAAFLDGLGDASSLCAIECHVPAAVRERWAHARTAGDARGSDAGVDVVARLGAVFTGWDELDEHAILTVRSGLDADLLVDEIAEWLDTRASVVLPARARLATEADDGSRD
jgi:aminoglycoside phosphotransferase family enzyme/predicted kinase